MAPHAETDSDSILPERSEGSSYGPNVGLRGKPAEEPCLSYWHRTTRGFQHLHANHDTSVPRVSKYVIIGAGLSGSLTAWELLETGVDGQDVLILEAREAVSGASGRNAGHVRPDAFRGFVAYSATHGEVQAKKIIENERLVFERIDQFVKKHNVPCDFEPTTTFDVCLTESFAKHEADSLESYKAAGGDVSHIHFYEGAEARRKTRVESAIAAYEWPAGSSHPAKLAQWLLSAVIERGVRLWTHCPAEEVTKHLPDSEDDNGRWIVETPRGSVIAESIVHCTNAYAAHLVPRLQTFITPNRAQAHSFVPTFSLTGSGVLTSTMSLRYSLHHFFSLIQRRGDGTVIFGVSRGNPGWSEATKASIVSFDDLSYNEEVAATSAGAFRKLFPDLPPKKTRHGEGADHYWSGIIAMTPDSVPMVGEIEGLEGQWICAGFNGHGMARIFTCAPGLVKLMNGEPWEATGLPECFEYSDERLNKAAQKNMKSVW